MAQVQYIGTGRRKSSVARVRLVPGNGKITVNDRDITDYIPFEALREVVKQPVSTPTLDKKLCFGQTEVAERPSNAPEYWRKPILRSLS